MPITAPARSPLPSLGVHPVPACLTMEPGMLLTAASKGVNYKKKKKKPKGKKRAIHLPCPQVLL